jgi:peptidyl-prolyl cis-trans isomerase D
MLTMMRNLLSSKLGLGLFGLIIIAMAGWGVTDIFSGGLGTNLAKAGSRDLTLERFETQVEQYLRVQRQSDGEIVSQIGRASCRERV